MTIAACGEHIIRLKHASFQWDQWGEINGDSAKLEPAAGISVAHQLLSSGASTPITNQRLMDSVLRELIQISLPSPREARQLRTRIGSVPDVQTEHNRQERR